MVTPTTVTHLQRERLSSVPEGGVCEHLLDEHVFKGALLRERKRADRSNQPLALLLVTCDGAASQPHAGAAIVAAVMAARCETHIVGWFEERRTIGLIAP